MMAILSMTRILSSGAMIAWTVLALPVSAEPAEDGTQSNPRSAPKGDASATGEGATEEVIVTAQKRSERPSTVPIPLTVIGAERLEQQGKDSLSEYFGTVPGLDFSSIGGGQQTLAIRGLATTALSNTTVAVTIDDVPFGSSSFLALGSTSYPDIDPAVLARIEVLRGPQGTLYGASSLGGVLKFVTQDPGNTLGGRVVVGGSTVEDGGAGHNLSGLINVPVAEHLAVQASGFTRRDPGYITNTLTGERHVNEVDTDGGRIAARAGLGENVSLKISALLQNTRGEGGPAVDTDPALVPISGLSQSRLPGTDSFRNEIRLYSATLTANLGDLELTSVSGFNTLSLRQGQDSTLLYGPVGDLFYGLPGAVQAIRSRTHRFTQELRLASNSGGTLDWLVGVFFNDERSKYIDGVTANAGDGSVGGDIVTFDAGSTTREYSAFGNLTFNLTERFDVQLGGRAAQIRQSYEEIDSGPFIGETPLVTPDSRTRDQAITYSLTPRFRITPALMIYGRFASGYRPGGLNINAVLSGNPPSFAPDKTYNYEVGAKGALLDGALSFDASLYYIDWNNIQIQLNNANLELFTANAGGARSAGAELAVESHPMRGLTLGGNLAYNDAVLTSDFPPEANGLGKKGDRLPFSSKVTGTLFADTRFDLTQNWQGSAGVSANYVGARRGEFPAFTPSRINFPSYVQLDLRAGARYGSWSLDLFANNLTDRRGRVGGTGFASAGSGANIIFIQPRTFGASFGKTF
jgi:iron complex outermembrane recepter protein